MTLDSLFSIFKRRPEGEPALADARARVPQIAKLGGPARQIAAPPETAARQPAGPVDQVQISAQAAFVLAASQYNPSAITETETQRMSDGLYQGKAISARDRAILVKGPQSGAERFGSQNAPRNLLAAFQTDISDALGRSDFVTVETSSRAVSILGRVASLREVIL
ncbi:MAG: hypothetical protein QNJ84_10090 [Alphaproteobacteria bacterium]|nr:hypothetical protein [Alphaproteobacteria bacterium]